MKRLVLIVFAFFAFAGNYCNAKSYETITINPGDFSSFFCNVPCDMKYAVGKPAVIITAEQKLLNEISAEVRDGELRLSVKDHKLRGLNGIKVYVTGPSDICAVTFNGAADFECESPIRLSGDFTLKLNGASDFEMSYLKADNIFITVNGVSDCSIDHIVTKNLTATINGAGDIDLGGECVSADLSINGAGEIDIEDLKTQKVDSSIKGAGSISRD